MNILDPENQELIEILRISANIEIKPNDKLPKHICTQCKQGLEFAYRLRNLGKANEKKFQNEIEQMEIEGEEEDEESDNVSSSASEAESERYEEIEELEEYEIEELEDFEAEEPEEKEEKPDCLEYEEEEAVDPEVIQEDLDFEGDPSDEDYVLEEADSDDEDFYGESKETVDGDQDPLVVKKEVDDDLESGLQTRRSLYRRSRG